MSEEPVIVVVEDDPNIADLVELYLRRDGYRPYQAPTGERALEIVALRRPKLVILDIGLPGELDGIDVCRSVRAESDVPIIFLTARDDEVDRVLGLELGADDYVTKPFSPRELVARVKAILRRTEAAALARNDERPEPIDLGADIIVDSARREVTVGGAAVALATREFDLLLHLSTNRGLALSRRQLLDSVWGDGWIGDDRTVDVHVRQLRKKLGDGLVLETVWGVGYRLD
ncbi:MAG: response regulator transcription factor [Acidimicrobiales bacterium]